MQSLISHNADLKAKLNAAQQEISNLKHEIAMLEKDFSIEQESLRMVQQNIEQDSIDANLLKTSLAEAQSDAAAMRSHIDDLKRKLVEQHASFEAALKESERRGVDAVRMKVDEFKEVAEDNNQLRRLLEDQRYSVSCAEASYQLNEQRLLEEKERIRSELLEATREIAALR